MKRIYLLVASVFILAACSFLDKMPDDMKTDEMVWTNRNEVLKYLTNIYAALPYDNLHQNDPWLGCSDECDIPWAVYQTSGITAGNWEPSTNFYVKWGTYYKAIRASFVFENNISRCHELSADVQRRYVGEAVFLRAYYYFLLLRQYGPVVLITEQMSNSTDFGSMQRSPFDDCVEYIAGQLDRAEELLPYSYEAEPLNMGRATKVACRAVKAELLLLAASEQWNGNKEYYDAFRNNDGTPLVASDYEPEKWRRAADAARSVIELAENHWAETKLGLYYAGQNVDSKDYNPYKAYYNILNTGWNEEIIWGSIDQGGISYDNRGVRYAWMIHTIPTGINCMGAVGPTLRLVDAFYMNNGRSIDDPLSGYVEEGFAVKDGASYNPKGWDTGTETGRKGLIADLQKLDAWGHSKGDWNMYVNREARFYASVNYNHRVQITYSDEAKNRNKFNSRADQKDGWGRCELYYGGGSNSGTNLNYTMTGMLTQKKVVPGDFTNNTFSGSYVSLYIRYAGILLDYIEALNEVEPSHPDIKKYWDMIRKRAGLPGIFETVPNIKGDKMQQRAYILRERQIELNFEGDRFYTCHRRWLSGSDSSEKETRFEIGKFGDGGPVWGLSVRAGDPKTNSFKSTEFYQRTAFETRVFRKAMYLFPIPQSEIDKSPGLVQNPWW